MAFGATFGGMTANAQNGQPHSLSADVKFADVTLSWKLPTEELTLQWHNDYAYNGVDGTLNNAEGYATIYAANKFAPEDLKAVVGETVETIKFFEYRELIEASVLIYENGVVVREQEVDLSNYEKNSYRLAPLDEPYVIPANAEVMFVAKYVHGRNAELTANCDESPTIGKGNVYSYDGKNWKSDAPGDFIVTAILRNTAETTPDGYNVYRDGTKVNETIITSAKEYVLTGETDGKHAYKVAAVYGADEKMSTELEVKTTSVYNKLPAVSGVSASINNLTGTLTWNAPLKRGEEMTWSNKTLGNAIGGTAASNTKVWIKAEFDVDDLAAFPNHQIDAINAFVAQEGGILTVTAFVIKNGVIDYYEVINDDVVAGIQPNTWVKYTLKEPYKLEVGNSYAYGLYYTQTPKMHPVGVDNGNAVPTKGNSFSVSSPTTSGFEKSKPSWKTLESGGIAGNFMLTADVEPLSEEAMAPQEISGYDVYRDGKLIAENVAETTYTDNVDDLGTYKYSVVAKSADGKESSEASAYAIYRLPAEYKAPVITNYDQTGKDITFSWSDDAYELKHYGSAAYMVGFDEEISMLYGAKFSKEELADYAGYEFSSITFGIADDMGAFKVELYDSDKTLLFSKNFEQGAIEPRYLYTVTLNDNERVSVPADKDLYLVYNATLPAGSSPILLDAGPLVDGGAMVSLTGGANWMKLGTLQSIYNNYNIIISGLITAPTGGATGANNVAKTGDKVTLGVSSEQLFGVKKLTADDNSQFGVSPAMPSKAAAKASTDKIKAKNFRIYRDNELVTETTSGNYSETLDKYGVFNYYVTSVFENGWESPRSRALTFSNIIEQKTQAPYDLQGETSGSNLKLTWSPTDAAPELSYHTDTQSLAYGMTGGSTIEGYHAIRFAANEISDKVGEKVSHVKFMLNETNLISASVVILYCTNDEDYTDGKSHNGGSIVYEQEIDVNDLVVGWNTVALNNPVPVVAGKGLGVGYHLSYKSGVKPFVTDSGPAVAGYGDLISSSASQGYWYSLAKKYNVNGNYRISAVLKKADTVSGPAKVDAAENGVTYNVYRDGALVAEGVGETTYTVTNAAAGSYTVTAVTANGESNESNAVKHDATTGISQVENASEAATGNVFGIDGQLINSAGDTQNLKKGVYIINGKKVVVK